MAERTSAEDPPRSTAALFGHPIHAILVPFPIACFVGTLVTDLAYWKTDEMQWANFSAWLISVGVAMAALAAVFGIVDLAGERRIRDLATAWVHGAGNAVVLALAIVDALVHWRDGATSVAPTGLLLSALIVALLLVTGWLGGRLVFRHGVGVRRGAGP